MQLVMRRERLEGGWSNFQINARMVLDPQEKSIVDKYKLSGVIITEGDRRRDIRRAVWIAAPVSALLTLILVNFLPGSPFLVLFILIFTICCYLIYQQIREEVRVDDLLTGRDFRARSFLGLLYKENSIRKMSAIFVHVLDQARTWEEPEVIELAPQPLLSVLEGERAAA